MSEQSMAQQSPIWQGWPLIFALICGAAAYSNSLSGPFIFDDIDAMHSIAQGKKDIPTTLSGRPVLRLTFDLDYGVGGTNVRIYHLTNLLIHLACGAVLFGIVRRNLSEPSFWHGSFEHSSHWLAGAVTALWLVHPLNTEAVTYVVQRAESLAGLFYLLVIYCVVRDWKWGAVIGCVLGIATKEMVVTAPIMALLYDRTFISGSLKAALKRRKWMYLALAATWLTLTISFGARGKSVGNILPIDYAMTELGVIAHYIALAVWPARLVLDYYDWPIAHSANQISVGGWLVLVATILTIIALWRQPWLGFLGAWFFGILAPSSSLVPVFTEIAAEHRMYLPVIAIVLLMVVGGWRLLSRGMLGAWIAAALFMISLVALSARTYLHNAQYQNADMIWEDTIASRPNNPRAHFNLGYERVHAGDVEGAIPEFERALEIEPNYSAAMLQLERAEASRSGGLPR
jgi:hypothetical protein